MGSSSSGMGWTGAAHEWQISGRSLFSALFFHGCCYKAKGELGQDCAALGNKRSAGEAASSVAAMQVSVHQVSLLLVCSLLPASTSRAALTTLDLRADALPLQLHCVVSSSPVPNPSPWYSQVSWIPQTDVAGICNDALAEGKAEVLAKVGWVPEDGNRNIKPNILQINVFFYWSLWNLDVRVHTYNSNKF